MTSKNGGASCAPRCPSGGWSSRADVASLAVHLMVNTAVTGATYDIDGGEQDVADAAD